MTDPVNIRREAVLMLLSIVVGCTSPNEKNSSSNDTGNSEQLDSTDTAEETDTSENTDSADEDRANNEETSSEEYCANNDPSLSNCDPENNFDPWIAGTGETPFWIRDQKTEVIPFTNEYGSEIEYGYLQITSPESVRERTEDIFHVWFSETPNGAVLEGFKCEWYTTQATGNVYWTQKGEDYGDQMCDLGIEPRTIYLNFETRCHINYYNGLCDDENKQKSSRTYQFDVARRFSN